MARGLGVTMETIVKSATGSQGFRISREMEKV